MKLFYSFVIIVFCISTYPLLAQSDSDKAIKDAKSQTAKIASDPKKLPDSLKWKTGGNISLNFSQTSLSNWAAGGEPTVAVNTTLNVFANYKKNKFVWENYGFFAYGILKQGSRDATKNDDQININSRVGYEMAKNWYYTASFIGKTQFAPGYKYSSDDTVRISDFFAPVYLYLSLGLDYKPSDKFSMLMSPVMGKATLVRSDDPTVMRSSGLTQELIDDGKHSRYEFGGGIIFNMKDNFFSKRVTYTTQLELFSNYLDKPQNIDIVWDFQFRIALTRFVSAGLRLNMIYDDDQKTTVRVQENGAFVDKPAGAKLQVKEYFEIGLFYGF